MSTPSLSHSDSLSTGGRASLSSATRSSLSSDSACVQYLQRSDGTILSPHADPLTVRHLGVRDKDEEVDPLSSGDDALFSSNMVTLISVNWTTSMMTIPFGTVRMHQSNRVHHVPLMDLCHVHDQTAKGASADTSAGKEHGPSECSATASAQRSRLHLKLSDETLMKLPHHGPQLVPRERALQGRDGGCARGPPRPRRGDGL